MASAVQGANVCCTCWLLTLTVTPAVLCCVLCRAVLCCRLAGAMDAAERGPPAALQTPTAPLRPSPLPTSSLVSLAVGVQGMHGAGGGGREGGVHGVLLSVS